MYKTIEEPSNVKARLPKILLISSFFPLKHAKHSDKQYTEWLSHYLQTIEQPILMYTSSDYAPIIRQLRGSKPVYIDTTYEHPFKIPPLLGKEEMYKFSHQKDREAAIHNIDLYAVWNAKPFLVQEAANKYHNEFQYFFWNDAGAMRRPHAYRNWPNPLRVEQVGTFTLRLNNFVLLNVRSRICVGNGYG